MPTISFLQIVLLVRASRLRREGQEFRVSSWFSIKQKAAFPKRMRPSLFVLKQLFSVRRDSRSDRSGSGIRCRR